MNEVISSLPALALSLAVLLAFGRTLTPHERPWLAGGLVVHAAAAIVKVVIVMVVYERGDLISYLRVGGQIAEWMQHAPGEWVPKYMLHALDWGDPAVPIEPPGRGPTAAMFVLSALYQTVLGATPYAMSLTAAVFVFASKSAMYLVFRDILPARFRTRLMLVIYYLPSLAFWANAFSKEGIAFAFIGWALLGYYDAFHRGRPVRGLALLGVAAFGVSAMKPYILFPMVVGMAVWEYWRRTHRRAFNPFRSLALGGLAFSAGFGILAGLGAVFPRYSLDNIAQSSEELIETGMRVEGGSAYSAVVGSGVTGLALSFPGALAAALYRPFLFEANNAFALISALETSMWLALTVVVVWRRGLGALQVVWGSPVLMFCVVYVLLFGFATGYTSTNLGTLSRYRTPMLPYLGVLMAVLTPLRVGAAVPAPVPARIRRRTPRDSMAVGAAQP